MTGSGSCFFIGFQSVGQAEVAHQKMLAKIRTDFFDIASAGLVQVADPRFANPIKATMVSEGLTEHPLRYWIES
jgi:hypothetical protein